jgi:hypothetical protein|tara:strand:- start:74 stop:214 length:141 start_codon:yes stop_codon:yes gene_type:complete
MLSDMLIKVEPPEYEIGLASMLVIVKIERNIFISIPMGGILSYYEF